MRDHLKDVARSSTIQELRAADMAADVLKETDRTTYYSVKYKVAARYVVYYCEHADSRPLWPGPITIKDDIVADIEGNRILMQYKGNEYIVTVHNGMVGYGSNAIVTMGLFDYCLVELGKICGALYKREKL